MACAAYSKPCAKHKKKGIKEKLAKSMKLGFLSFDQNAICCIGTTICRCIYIKFNSWL